LPYNREVFAGYEFVQLHMDGKWGYIWPLVAQWAPAWVAGYDRGCAWR
jgi:hypothetical protein